MRSRTWRKCSQLHKAADLGNSVTPSLFTTTVHCLNGLLETAVFELTKTEWTSGDTSKAFTATIGDPERVIDNLFHFILVSVQDVVNWLIIPNHACVVVSVHW